ncbi:uncharacterized protein G2W53_043414 [Senna tora]|uniref:Uncharacterized protein n=1 Tax=Senna tora TaxID=362788 RepID=A0A834VZW6_9FABA|nr:uncharacterized protein G2W53_043414 [Senna tora]
MSHVEAKISRPELCELGEESLDTCGTSVAFATLVRV